MVFELKFIIRDGIADYVEDNQLCTKLLLFYALISTELIHKCILKLVLFLCILMIIIGCNLFKTCT